MKTLVHLGALSLLALLPMTTLSQAADEKPVRTIPIPQQEHGYSNFETTVISSQAALDQFLEKMSAAPGWNGFDKFKQALTEAKPDFEKETLALIRHDEGSGSVQLTPKAPQVEGKKIIFKIDRKAPEMGTADMAFHCFALAVSKGAADAVELQVEGRQPQTVALKE